ncbi:MAG: hypothetical protein WEF51_01390 [Chloroflexota bacterium]
MGRLVTLLWIVAIVGTAAACSPNPAGPELTDPREILGKTIQSTASLRSMRVRLDLESREQARPGDPQGGFAEGVLDLGTGEMSLAGAGIDGTGAFDYIQADGFGFARISGNDRWSKVPAMGGIAGIFLMGGGAVGPAVDVPAALADLVDDPETVVELRGVEDCATGRCYRTIVGLPPAQVWKLIVGLTGIDKLPGGAAAQLQPAGIPPVSFEILTDTATLRLVDLVATGTADGSSVAVRIRVAAPNEPVAIEPPPPNLVDDPGATLGGGGFVAPPAPVVKPVPVPAETIGP